MDTIIECIIEHIKWIFSGIGTLFIKNRKNKKQELKKSNHISVSEQKTTNSSVNAVNEVNNSPITQIGNQNNYYEHDANDTTKYDALLIEYIDTILKKFREASKELPLVGVSDSNRWLYLIQNAIIDDKWKEYIEKSSLSAGESVQLKKWFNIVMNAISITHNQSYDIRILESQVNVVISDSKITEIRTKLEQIL